jgi:dienelactone hydrolase
MYGEIAKLQAEIISKVPDAQVMADLDAALQWAGKNGGNANRAAITGFCWGDASRGSTQHTTQRSKQAWLGTVA